MPAGQHAGVARVRHADHALLRLVVGLGQITQTVHFGDEKTAVLDLALLGDDFDLRTPVDDARCAVDEEGLNGRFLGRVEMDGDDEGPLIPQVEGVRRKVLLADDRLVLVPTIEMESVTLFVMMDT